MDSPCHCALLRRAMRRVTALYDEALEPIGINVAQYSLLENVSRTEPVSLTALGAILELDRSTIGRNVKLLVERGLLERGASEQDQRETTVRLSDAGREVLRDALPVWAHAQKRIETALGNEGTDTLHRLLDGLGAEAVR